MEALLLAAFAAAGAPAEAELAVRVPPPPAWSESPLRVSLAATAYGERPSAAVQVIEGEAVWRSGRLSLRAAVTYEAFEAPGWRDPVNISLVAGRRTGRDGSFGLTFDASRAPVAGLQPWATLGAFASRRLSERDRLGVELRYGLNRSSGGLVAALSLRRALG